MTAGGRSPFWFFPAIGHPGAGGHPLWPTDRGTAAGEWNRRIGELCVGFMYSRWIPGASWTPTAGRQFFWGANRS